MYDAMFSEVLQLYSQVSLSTLRGFFTVLPNASLNGEKPVDACETSRYANKKNEIGLLYSLPDFVANVRNIALRVWLNLFTSPFI